SKVLRRQASSGCPTCLPGRTTGRLEAGRSIMTDMHKPTLRSAQFVTKVIIALLSLLATRTATADKVVLIAGGGTGGDNIPATEAKVAGPFGLAFDKAGNMYIG